MIDSLTATTLADGLNAGRSATAIEARDLIKTYGGKVRALDGLSFTVEAGAIFALLGPNGAGKSTTIKILNTLSSPDSGSARVAGFDVLREPERVRRAIGCVAQKSGVDPEATGRENLTLQGRIYGLRGQELRERVDELLKRFWLTEAADLVARTYSGGMQRKLDVAMGLVHRPRVLFLDEPTTGLDPEARADLWDDISRLANDDGITVLLTTHYLEEADQLAGRLAIVDRGKLVVEGTPDRLKGELLGDAIHIEFTHLEVETRVREALDRLDGLSEIVVEAHSLRARAAQGATAVPGMLAALESKGLKVASVKVARPSLDDVYLRYTGRSFNEADKANQKGAR
ncbi:MAG TPA: ATP-binding cassette domain-containing protein [Blastocatellia bacterium]|nr:ATP-binding cassette domain-containing protein [Blastocatellia bacterium]